MTLFHCPHREGATQQRRVHKTKSQDHPQGETERMILPVRIYNLMRCRLDSRPNFWGILKVILTSGSGLSALCSILQDVNKLCQKLSVPWTSLSSPCQSHRIYCALWTVIQRKPFLKLQCHRGEGGGHFSCLAGRPTLLFLFTMEANPASLNAGKTLPCPR